MISFRQVRSNALSLGVETERAEKKNPIVAFTLKFLKC